MMIIKNDEDTFVIPFDDFSKNACLVSIDQKEKLINSFREIMDGKKRIKVCLFDDDGNQINKDEINFIYTSSDVSFDNNFQLKTKSITNSSICNFIDNNAKDFESVERIRNELINLETDIGTIKINKILSKGLDNKIKIIFDNFDISSIIQMLSIKSDNDFDSYKQIVIYNLLLYVNRNKTNIIYIDNYYDFITEKWIQSLDRNAYVLIDNNCVFKSKMDNDLLILNNCNHIIKKEATKEEINIISYMLHPIVKANIDLQNEKNIELFNSFIYDDSTFFIKNTLQNI